ncbi:hypothetical protein J2S00_002544 [Caldalkalibacillus uzonensis]|uniref:Cytochrome c oxidase subunit 2A n=1 Tax=Caldalkalibacillus uzonensis TaxID=353224 RepID=A0ABU0CV18_9BACI|nr:cytochrome c oxidase subunit 2A [Caldalkalibacillus uzonensis]MDQ0339751.1 hypothetical protein [Caldalkalibacillus uzonensis]
MSKVPLNEVDKHHEDNLKGSFLLVFVIAGIILVMWFGVFYLYVKWTL